MNDMNVPDNGKESREDGTRAKATTQENVIHKRDKKIPKSERLRYKNADEIYD